LNKIGSVGFIDSFIRSFI